MAVTFLTDIDKKEISKQIDTNTSSISRNDKRISNLEKGKNSELYHVDDTVAYRKDVPASALSFAEVGMVGGRTLKWNQLMDTNQIRTATHNGITLTFNGDGSITVNGQATERATFNGAGAKPVQVINGHRYYINCGDVTVHVGWAINSSENRTDEQIVTATEDFEGYPTIDVFSTETVFSNKTFFPKIVDLTVMYGAGNEPTKAEDCRFTSGYEPYDEGSLRSAPVTEVESVGVNLFDSSKVVSGHRCNTDGAIIEHESYSTSDYIAVKGGATYYLTNVCGNAYCSVVQFNINKVVIDSNAVGNGTQVSGAVKVNENTRYIRINIYTGITDVNTVMVHRGDTALPYTPYMSNTLPVPEAVQALDGYGWGMSDTVYNYIDWEKKQFVKRVGRVDLGTLEWQDAGLNNGWYADLTYKMETGVSLCDVYNSTVGYLGLANMKDKECSCRDYTIYIIDNSVSSASEIKGTFMFALATPVITDISDLLTEDNYIPVEGGGTVTMLNEYEYAVPSEITYALKEVAE